MRPRWGKDQPAVDAFDRQGDADGTADRVRQVHHLADTISRAIGDRKSTRLNSSHSQISYAVVCLTKKKRWGRSGNPSSRRRGSSRGRLGGALSGPPAADGAKSSMAFSTSATNSHAGW